MATDVVMPQMGESIFEGTVTKWLKKPGDAVERDEPLFEISTDKVDAEIPSPIAGMLQEIKVEAGATVQVNAIVAVIGEAASDRAAKDKAASVPLEPQKTNGQADKPADPKETDTTEIVMPQMGESIFEGTITKWLKKVGERIERDEPLFEISTDKVDAEIPAPLAGTLLEIRAEAGATVQVNTTVAMIGNAARAASASPQQAKSEPAAIESKSSPTSTDFITSTAEHEQRTKKEILQGVRSSPLVRKMAKEHDVDLHKVVGSGSAGRVTKEDMQAFLAKAVPASHSMETKAQAPATPSIELSTPSALLSASTALVGQLVPMSKMRLTIAQRMVESKRTNAHVHTVFKVDMTRIVRLRDREKVKYEQRNGVKLTFMPFIARAVTATLRRMPIVNASIEADAIRYHRNVNLGIAVALDWGLIVPVIRQAEERSFLGVARAIADLAERARSKKLKPDEVGDSTFTLTNAGIYGEQFGTPIIHMPGSAILGIGGLTKEASVVTDELGSDSIAIRNIIHLTLGFDHRIIDGADAGKFMADVKSCLESWSEDIG